MNRRAFLSALTAAILGRQRFKRWFPPADPGFTYFDLDVRPKCLYPNSGFSGSKEPDWHQDVAVTRDGDIEWLNVTS